MPYWNRQTLLNQSIQTYRKFYGDIEICVCDDGSTPKCEGDAIIKHLPQKETAMNPCVPINEAVRLSTKDIIVITNPEIIHREPILEEMLKSLEDRKDYIIAAAWSVEYKRWYCHSTVNGMKCSVPGASSQPDGAGFRFCTMMTKDFYWEIGGFDEQYREGQAYDDNDFVWSLWKNGAKFKMRDDLVVDHYRTKTQWPSGGNTRNKRIFEKKWKNQLLS